MIITSKNCLVPECEGANHRWEFERPTAREILRIQQASGQDIDAWSDGLNGISDGVSEKALLAALALVDILHRRGGVRVPFDDIDVDLYNLDFEMEAGEVDEEPAAEDAAGKDQGPTTVSLPPEDVAPASTSGPAPEAESEPKSSPTPTTSGDASASP